MHMILGGPAKNVAEMLKTDDDIPGDAPVLVFVYRPGCPLEYQQELNSALLQAAAQIERNLKHKEQEAMDKLVRALLED